MAKTRKAKPASTSKTRSRAPVKPTTKAKRRKWSAHRVNTMPANGGLPDSREVAPALVPVGEAVRRAVEALGDVTVDDDLAPRQLRQLAELYDRVTEEQAAYDAKAEAAKVAKKALESATNLLLEQVRAFTHAVPLPLFDQTQAEDDRAKMVEASGDAAVEIDGSASA